MSRGNFKKRKKIFLGPRPKGRAFGGFGPEEWLYFCRGVCYNQTVIGEIPPAAAEEGIP